MNKPLTSKSCACGSQIDFVACCGLYINNHQTPPSPETLMRSRYTAYSLVNIAYIKNTMRGKSLVGFDEIKARGWASKAIWVDLCIVNTIITSDTLGYVEFIARFIEEDKLKSIHETSEFLCDQGRWFYVGGVQEPTKSTIIIRNKACPCGSQKKYKNCHAKK